MKISFIGISDASLNIAVYLKSKGFIITGIYCENIKSTIDSAIKINCHAYLDKDKAIENADIVFIGDSEDKIRMTLHKINKHKYKQKIFCVISAIQNSTSIGISDTSFSLFALKRFSKDEISGMENTMFIIEGNGKRYWDFIDELEDKNINFKIVDKNEKSAYLLSFEFVTEFSDALYSTAGDILKRAGIYETSFLKDIVCQNGEEYFNTPKSVSYFDTPLNSGNVAYINNHFNAMDLYANKNDKSIYKVMAFSVLENSMLDKEEKDRIKRIILEK